VIFVLQSDRLSVIIAGLDPAIHATLP